MSDHPGQDSISRSKSNSVRKLLNKLLYPVGYRIERVSRFRRELDVLLQKTAGRFKFVQIGANDGVRFDSLYSFVTNHSCSGIVVEPLPDMFARLRTNYADYPQIIPVNKAIHETARTLSLFRVSLRRSALPGLGKRDRVLRSGAPDQIRRIASGFGGRGSSLHAIDGIAGGDGNA